MPAESDDRIHKSVRRYAGGPQTMTPEAALVWALNNHGHVGPDFDCATGVRKALSDDLGFDIVPLLATDRGKSDVR